MSSRPDINRRIATIAKKKRAKKAKPNRPQAPKAREGNDNNSARGSSAHFVQDEVGEPRRFRNEQEAYIMDGNGEAWRGLQGSPFVSSNTCPSQTFEERPLVVGKQS
ncbi:uncharacterized protein, partial [Penaeus vannamei]|uniref:uncharacterized protein n=1 Tax=Penaeus vannamei TaxID=6689 RepID=UPI00387F4874